MTNKSLWQLSPLCNIVRGVAGVENLRGFRGSWHTRTAPGSRDVGAQRTVRSGLEGALFLPTSSLGPPYGVVQPKLLLLLGHEPPTELCTPLSWNLHIGFSGHVRDCQQF